VEITAEILFPRKGVNERGTFLKGGRSERKGALDFHSAAEKGGGSLMNRR